MSVRDCHGDLWSPRPLDAQAVTAPTPPQPRDREQAHVEANADSELNRALQLSLLRRSR